ncbi:MAG: hypothetical protein JWO98_4730 [Frankiales bacterium]|nr:hypothetical protein [Frankiales bacterium]
MTTVTLEDVKDFLRIPSTDTASDDKLVEHLDAAWAAAEFYCGDLSTGTYTEVHDGGGQAIYTRHTPVASVISLTEYIGSITYTLTNQPLGSSVDAWGYTIDDPDVGRIVRRSASGIAWRFVPGVGNVRIAYTTGRAVVPAQVTLGVKIVVQHLWETQRVPGVRGASADTSPIPGLGYAIPNRAIELFQTVPRMPVIG